MAGGSQNQNRPSDARPSDARPSDPSSLASSLLVRIRLRDERAWQRLAHLYEPIIRAWCRRAGLQEGDAADVAQEVFQAAFTGIDRFRRDAEGQSFRGWLHGITRNKVHDLRRRAAHRPQAVGGTEFGRRVAAEPAPLDAELWGGELADESADESAVVSPEERSLLYRRALDLMRTDFAERTWRAFWATTVDGRPAADVAAEMGMTVGAVYVAKSRVLNRLRAEFTGLEEFAS
jgi:RNA polymerase sigma-70 factor (ECF subfamily)